MKKSLLLALGVVLLLAAILRLFKITDDPPGLYPDEVAIGYNAYSILKTGRDEWGNSYPLLFRSYGDYKLPVYIYLTAAFEDFLGPTDLAVRLPSALAGIIAVVGSFFLAQEIFFLIKREADPRAVNLYSLIVALLLATSSWHIQFSRAGFEANLALTFVILGTWLFLSALRNNIRFLPLSAIFFVTSLYTYHSERIFVPPLLLVLFLLFRKTLLKRPKIFVATCLVSLLLAAPILALTFSGEGLARLKTESIFNESGPVWENFQTNYLANFSPDYLFFHGDQNGRHSVKKIGELYLWQLPFFLLGTYALLNKRSKAGVIVFSWLLLAAVPSAITRVSPHALRGLLMVLPFEIICAFGLWVFVAKFPKWLIIGLGSLAVYEFLIYLHIYYVHYPVAYAADWEAGQEQTALYLRSREDHYGQIFVHPNLSPVYLLFYLPYDPRALQAANHDLSTLGKYQYHNLYTQPVKADSAKKSLIVVPPNIISADRPGKIREIKMTGGNPAFEIYEF